MYVLDVTELSASIRIRDDSPAVVKFTCSKSKLPRDQKKPEKPVPVEVDGVTYIVSARDYVFATQLASTAIFEKRKEARQYEQSKKPHKESPKKKRSPDPQEFQQYWAGRLGEKP